MDKDEKSTEKTNNNRYTKAIIIGAGMAGLSAANHLSKNGFKDFKILEARNRIGGRIIQIDIGSTKVELGANWIHGVLGNPIYELAMSNGLIDINFAPKPHKIIASTENGKQVPFNVLQEIYEAYMTFFKRCEEYFLCQYIPPTGIHSVGDHIKLEINLYLDTISDISDRHLRHLIFDCLLKRETCITGCDDMNEIDLLEIGSYTELQGGNIVLPNGYSSIIGPASKHIPEDAILLNHPVTHIHWYNNVNNSHSHDGNESDDSDRTVTGDEPSLKEEVAYKNIYSKANVEIECENGERFYADHVICTIPLGVLKEEINTLFSPPLPEEKFEAIERLLFGTVDKIFLEYDRPFLNPEITEVMLLWENDLPNKSKRTDDDEEVEDLSKSWFKKIYSFSKITDTLIMGWVSGLAAEYMETLPSEVVAEKCTEILRKFLNDPFIPKPRKCICTSWAKQPYTRGSYTSIGVGACQLDIEILAQPLFSKPHQPKPVLLFAGEHTHSNFYSTVHGAYLSGRTAAQYLLESGSATETILECPDESDLASWIEGIALE